MGADRSASAGLLPPLSEDILPADIVTDARVIVVVVIDGLGALNLADGQSRGDTPGFDSAHHASTLTSVFPSTTAAATTSLQYGSAPGTHGLAGYTIYLPSVEQVVNMITWKVAQPGNRSVELPDPATMLEPQNIFRRISSARVGTVIVSNAAFESSSLTRAQAAGVRYRGYRTPAEFAHRLVREVERPGRRFVFGYWDGYDALGHTWGSDSFVARQELRLIDRAMREGFLDPLTRKGDDVAVLLTADHGHTATPRARRLDLAKSDGLLERLRHRPTGEPRQLGLAFQPAQAIRPEDLGARWPDKVATFAVGEAIEAGLFGPSKPHPELASRVGDVLLLARADHAFKFPGGSSGSVGGHGSLTPREMLVPLRVWRFGRG